MRITIQSVLFFSAIVSFISLPLLQITRSQEADGKASNTIVVNGKTIRFQIMDNHVDSIGVEVSHLTGKIRVGVDPENTSQLFHMIDQTGVVDELGLSEEQLLAWETYKVLDKEMRISPNLNLDAFRFARSVGLKEVLHPIQMDRLRQIAYRYEVSAIGLAGSLCEGRLSEIAGVTQSQADALWKRGQKFNEQKLEKIRKIKIRSETEVRAKLDREQSKLVVETIGDYYRLPVFALRNLSSQLSDSSPFSNPPESSRFFLALIDRDKDVQDELTLTEKQRKTINSRAVSFARLGPLVVSPPEPEFNPERLSLDGFLREQLTSNQLERVAQLAYRMEVEAMGLSRALAKGKLNEKISIREDQIDELLKLGNSIRSREHREILSVMTEFEDRMFESLDPLQREICREALGPMFVLQNTGSSFRHYLMHSKYAKPTPISVENDER